MTAANCETCYQHRWVWFAPRFGSNGLEGSWRPFVRDLWDQVPKVTQAAALATGTLKPCSCNPGKLAPWATEWKSPAAVPGQGATADEPY